MWYLFAGYAVATAVFSAIHVAATKKERTSNRVWGIILAYAILFNIGAAGLVAFYAHAFRAAETAQLIGWQAGSPFQYEVACANLAFGVLGVICLWMRSGFRLATILGYSVFLLGAAVGHLNQLINFDNKAPGNAGAPLYVDIIVPMALLTLWTVHFVISRRARERELLKQCSQQIEKGGSYGRPGEA
jgi:hypothetical protein